MDRLSAEMESMKDILCSINENGMKCRSMTLYVEESVQYCHLVPWDDQSLMNLFWIGLDHHLAQLIPPGSPTLTLIQYLAWWLWICGSPYTTEEVSEVKNNHQSQAAMSS